MQLIIAEKPSVARDLARALGVSGRQLRGLIEGKDRTITWCIGHLVELDEPASYDARWKAWRMDSLPILPERFKLRPVSSSREQLGVVRRLLCDRRFTEVVNACDAGREGELIFRYVYELAGSTLPVRRLWISSMTDEAIRAGFAGLRPGADYDALGDAARCRSEADWLVGLNATRAITVRHRDGSGKSPLFSVGRVQTPTLAILVERERAIAAFLPRDFWEVEGVFTAEGGTFKASWAFDGRRRLSTRALGDAVAARALVAGPAVVERLKQKEVREAPPLLFDLTSLQRTANRRFGLSAERTLQVAQALYERHKLLTYPRTDARHLPTDMRGTLPALFSALAAVDEYRAFALEGVAMLPVLGKRVFDDTKVGDHHAIIPTGKSVRLAELDRDEVRIFDLVVRRFLGAFMADAVFAVTEVTLRAGAETAPLSPVDGHSRPPGSSTSQDDGQGGEADDAPLFDTLPPPPDRFFARGRVRLSAGWQAVAGFGGGDNETQELPGLRQGQTLRASYEVLAKKTRPPVRHTDASLLGAMETAGREIEDESLRAAMKDSGLGTPATRASIIETLVKRGFVVRQAKNLVPTEMGMALIEALPVASLASPELTGRWEARLSRVARGEESRAVFMRDIVAYVREVVEAVRNAPLNTVMSAARVSAPRAKDTRRGTGRRSSGAVRVRSGSTRGPQLPRPPRFKVDDLMCPMCKRGTLITGKRGWGCNRWREGCKFVVWFEANGQRVTKAELKRRLTEHSPRHAPARRESAPGR